MKFMDRGGVTMGWISVEERLPEHGERVLVCDVYASNRYIGVWFLEKDPDDGSDCWEECGGWQPLDAATHWMPLPDLPKEEHMKKDKPLKDWMLGEVHNWCKSHIDHYRAEHGNIQNVCSGCRFLLVCQKDADGWDLTEKPRFTAAEVARVKAAMVLWPNAEYVAMETGAAMLYGADGKAIAGIDADMFPSILPGQSVKLSEIVGG